MYNGLVEAARTNSRLGHVVGDAYLRRASDKMRQEILPAATIVYEDAAVQLDDRYRDGTRRSAAWAVAATAAAAVLVVAVAQLYVTWRSRRWLNAGLLAAAADRGRRRGRDVARAAPSGGRPGRVARRRCRAS